MSKYRVALPSLALLLFALGANACDDRGAADPPRADGSAPADATTPAPDAIKLADFPTSVGRAICERRWACCSVAERQAAGFAPDEATCAMRLAVGLGLLLPEFESSVARGRAGYDGAALARCLGAYAGLTCPAAAAGVPPEISLTGCPYLVPQLPLGAACGQGFECVEGYCAGVRVNSDGICTAKKPNGAACLTLDECRSNHCDLDLDICAPVIAWPVCRPT